MSMAVGREQRRRERHDRAVSVFGADEAGVALDLLEIVELAWHDCHGQVSPPEDVVDDMFFLSDGGIDELVRVARLALADRRDLKVTADERRGEAT